MLTLTIDCVQARRFASGFGMKVLEGFVLGCAVWDRASWCVAWLKKHTCFFVAGIQLVV